MVALLCNESIVRSLTLGEIPVSQVTDGDQLIAYSPQQRQMGFVTVTVQPMEPQIKIGLMLNAFRWINLLANTMAYTNAGPAPISTMPAYFTSFCPMNPLKMSIREVTDVVEYGAVPATQIRWDNDAFFIWSEGLLIGNK